MVEMIKVTYYNMFNRGIISKQEYDSLMKLYRPSDLMEISRSEYEAKMNSTAAPVIITPEPVVITSEPVVVIESNEPKPKRRMKGVFD